MNPLSNEMVLMPKYNLAECHQRPSPASSFDYESKMYAYYDTYWMQTSAFPSTCGIMDGGGSEDGCITVMGRHGLSCLDLRLDGQQ